MTTITTMRRRRRRGTVAGLAAAVTVLGIPGQVWASPAAATVSAPDSPVQTQAITEIGGYLIGTDPNLVGVIPSSGVCSWNFNVFQAPTGTVYSALTCWGPLGPTYALVGTNPAIGCNDIRVCEFLAGSSVVFS